MTKDINGNTVYGLRQSDAMLSGKLASGVAKTVTVPIGMNVGIAAFSFEPGSSIWIAINNGNAVSPTGDPLATNSELNPSVREVNGGDIISLITSDSTADFSVSFYER